MSLRGLDSYSGMITNVSVLTATVVPVPADPSNYHDAFFREVMSTSANAVSELRTVLPEAVTACVDWGCLELQSTSFVTSELRPRYGDLLFRTRVRDRPAYIYVLIEHQSRPDPLMALRLLEYMIQVWNHHIGHNPATGTLPAVIPLVVYQSPSGRRWTAPLDIAELIDLDDATRAAVGPYIPRMRYALDNITRIDLGVLAKRELTSHARTTLALMKTAPGNPDLTPVLKMLRDDFRAMLAGPNGVRDLRLAFTYIMRVGETDPAEIEEFADELGPDAKEAFMTTAERLTAQAEARGEARGRVVALLQLLTMKFGPLPQRVVDTVEAGTLEQLESWTAGILTAEHIDQLIS